MSTELHMGASAGNPSPSLHHQGYTPLGILFAFFPIVVGAAMAMGMESLTTLSLGFVYLVSVSTIVLRGFSLRGLLDLLLVWLLLVGPLLIHLVVRSDGIWLETAHLASAVIVAWLVSDHLWRAPWHHGFYIGAGLFTLLIFGFTDYGNNEHVNRTFWALPLLALWCPLALIDAARYEKVSTGPLLVMLWVGVISFSRSVVIAAALCLLAVAISRSTSDRRINTRLIGGIVVLVGLAVGSSRVREWVMNAGIVTRIVEQGLESGRFIFWGMYFSDLDLLGWLIGPHISVRQVLMYLEVGSEQNTLHNTLFQLQSLGGVLPALAVFAGGVVVYRQFHSVTGTWVQPALLVLLAKGMMDVIAFPQRFDVIYLMVFFAVLQYGRRRPRASDSVETGYLATSARA